MSKHETAKTGSLTLEVLAIQCGDLAQQAAALREHLADHGEQWSTLKRQASHMLAIESLALDAKMSVLSVARMSSAINSSEVPHAEYVGD